MKSQYALAALAMLALSSSALRAATMSASADAPVIDGEDIANYGDVSGTDKWWTGSSADSAAKGQTFTTGNSSVLLKSISYQISDGQKAEPNKTYAIRVGKVAGTNFSVVRSETATQNFTWNAGEFMTWTFDTPVLLEPYTTYGIDVGLLTSSSVWQTGIPYINLTADEYPGGARYASGVSGTGTSTLSYAIASDRIFHLDIERPLGPVFELVATYPADDATGVLASRNLVLTFSQNVTPGTGNLTIRNLTDATQTVLAANDPRLTYDQNAVRIDPADLLAWSKNYAVRIDAGTILGDGGAPLDAISDDTTWNFTTAAGDPLLDAIAALKNHITGALTLTPEQIAAIKTTIDAQRQRFAENTTNISAVFDLIATYDAAKGPLFVSGSTVTDFSRNNTTLTSVKAVIPENYHWVVYTVMQHTMDIIYTAETLADLAKRELIVNFNESGGYKFGSHTNFPGPCPPPADPANTHTVAINGSFPITFGRSTQQWTLPARKPTGTYLAPGTIATVTVPPALVNAGYKVRVGAHSWDLSNRPPVQRLERATRLYSLDSETIKVASPYGGGIYIEVPIGADAGVIDVTVTGAVRAPYFSAKSFHQTTPAEWDIERGHPAPWADFQSDKFMMQVPRTWIYNHPNPAQTMADWDAAMDAINDLMGFPRDRGKETMYCQVDIIMRSSVHAPGYPAVNVTGNPNTNTYAGYRNNYLVRGPGASATASHIEFHEQGHAYFFPKFGGESESTVNLLQPAMLHRKFGYDIDTAHRAALGSGNVNRTLDNTAIAWMCVFNFSPRNKPMADAEKAYQHKGHAKFLDIVRLFGWDGLDTYWRSFMEDDAAGISYPNSNDDKLLRLSKSVGVDIRPLFHFWGIHPQNPSALAAAIAAENIPAAPEIRNLLLHYKTLVPADNAAFRSFAQAWWGKKPSIKGYWEEREHSRQWDQEALFGTGDHQRADITTNEEYIEACADQVRAQVQELIDLYYPNSITPNPMDFAIAPTAVDATTIGMSATTANAAFGPIQYYFENNSDPENVTSSGWITSPSWNQTGLTTGLSYTFRVKARDGLETETDWSPTASATATADGDVTPPAPDPMTFATPPVAIGENEITMTATVAFDVNGVEYYFDNTDGSGNDSGWQDSPTYTDTQLNPSTQYSYRVQARDKSAGQNATAFSAIASSTTLTPDTTPPVILTLSPEDNATDFLPDGNLVITFDEPIGPNSGFITLKNLSDATQSTIDINDDSQVTISGATLTIKPTAGLVPAKNYAVQIDSTALLDLSENPFAGINDDTTWNFTTAVVPYVWTNTAGGAQDWTVGANWQGGNVPNPVAGDTVDFSTANITANTTLSLGADRTAQMWKFGDATTPGNDWTVNAGNSIILAGTTPTIEVVNRTATLDNVVDGTAGLIKSGAGLLILGGTNTYIGGTVISEGELRINNDSRLGGAGQAITFTGNATLGLTSSVTNSTRPITLENGAIANFRQVVSGGQFATSGAVTGNGGIQISSAINNARRDWAFSSFDNTFTGPVRIGDSGRGLTLTMRSLTDSNSTLRFGRNTANSESINFVYRTDPDNPVALTLDNRQIVLDGGGSARAVLDNQSGLAMTITKDLGWSTQTGNRTFELRGGSGNSFNGNIGNHPDSGVLSVTIVNGWTLTGNNTWSGMTDILAGGTLEMLGTDALPDPASLIQLSKGSTLRILTDDAGRVERGNNIQLDRTDNSTGIIQNYTIHVGNNGGATTGSTIVLGSIDFTKNDLRPPRQITTTGANGYSVEIGDVMLTWNLQGTAANGAQRFTPSTAALEITGTVKHINGDTGVRTNSHSLYLGGAMTGNRISGTITDADDFTDESNEDARPLSVFKDGAGDWTFTGTNTYTGSTTINAGTLVITGATQGTSAITFGSGGTGVLGLDTGVTVTASSAAVDLANGEILVSGTTGDPSYTLLIADSITGTPVLADPDSVTGYELQLAAGGTELRLVQTGALSLYDTWSGGASFDGDANNDGVSNGMAFLLGAGGPNDDALGLLPTVTESAGGLVLTFQMLDATARGAATLSIEHSNSLAIGSWTTVAVPDTSSTVDDVLFTVSGSGPLDVTATIPATKAASGKLFGRLKAENPQADPTIAPHSR